MNWMQNAMRRRRMEKAVSEDIEAHLAEKTADLMESGMAEQAARLAARREFGNALLVTENSRAVWRWTWLERLAQDLRHGVRLMGRSPGFTAVALLSLSLGIGANSAIFGLLDKIAWRTLPVRNPEELRIVGIRGTAKPGMPSKVGYGNSYPQFEMWRDRNRSFQALAGAAGLSWREHLTGTVGPEREAQMVSGNYFDILGVSPIVGRAIGPLDDSIDATGGPDGPVAMLSYLYWRNVWRSDPGAIGRQLNVNGVWVTVIGVTPPGFFGTQVGRSPDIFVPLKLQPLISPPDNLLHERPGGSSTTWVTAYGRLKPGISEQQAAADLMVAYEEYQLTRMSPDDRAAYLAKKKPLGGAVVLESGSRGISSLRDRFSESLKVLLALVGVVLLIACANIANLLLARGNARQKEMAVRLAIGAGRRRLVRQLLTESALLSFVGGALGLVVALWTSRLLIRMLPAGPGGVPPLLEVTPDPRVVAFTFGVAVATGILFGLAPALRATRGDVRGNLQRIKAGTTGKRFEFGKGIIAAEIALALPLMAGAGLFIGTLRNLYGIELGFTPQNILQVRLNPNVAGRPRAQWRSTYEQVIERAAAVPGVRFASLMNRGLMMDGGTNSGPLNVPGYRFHEGESRNLAEAYIGPDFFAASGIPLRAGRAFTARDGESQAQVAIVNESFARRYFNSGNPVGQGYSFGDSTRQIEIVGLAADSKYANIRQEPAPMAYYPWKQVMPARLTTLLVRTEPGAAAVSAALRSAVVSVHPDLFQEVQTIGTQIDNTLVRERMLAHLSGFFGGLALLLTCIGLYGVMAYAVTRRTQEIGVRIALGAPRSDVVRMVLRESLTVAACGLAIGIPLTLGLSRLTASFLFGVEPNDPVVLAAAIALMVTVCALAGYIPARRAARVDPMSALRYE